jgi:hypothetical protein
MEKEATVNPKRIYGLVISLAVVATALAFVASQVNAQDDIVAELRERLARQGVPVKDVAIVSRIPFKIEITLQSASTGQFVAPDDPIYGAAAQREVAAARGRGFKIYSLTLRIVNAQGQPITWADLPVDEALDTQPLLPSPLDDSVVAQVIREHLSLDSMSLDRLDIGRDINGAQVITITLSAKDIETANQTVPTMMWTLRTLVEQLKTERAAQIASYRVDIFDAQGQPLLKYVRDDTASESRENWWQAPGMTQDWFPHPPPPIPSH